MPPRWARAASRRSTASAPSLLNPIRLTTASSRSSRNSRGRGLPVCGFGVTVPISTKPNPSRNNASGASALLSKPAAMPIGLGKFRPNARTASFGSSGRGRIGGSKRKPWIARRCASSGSNQRNSGSENASKARITAKLRNVVIAVGPRAHAEHAGDRAEIEFAIEMRKQLVVARGLPAQRLPSASASTSIRNSPVRPKKCFLPSPPPARPRKNG